MGKSKQADKNYIAVIGKLFVVLERFVEESVKHQGVAFANLSKELPFSRTTIHRILYSLEKLGYVEKAIEASGYRLSRKFFELTERAVHLRRLQREARFVMQDLLVRHGETVNLGILDSGQVVYLEVFQSPSALRIAAFPGDRNPVHSTAVGKAIFAFLPESEIKRLLSEQPLLKKTRNTITQRAYLMEHLASIREQGIAFDMEENLNGVTCVAAPVFDQTGRVIAALSVSGPTSRMTGKLDVIKGDVRSAATALSKKVAPVTPQIVSTNTKSPAPRSRVGNS